MIGTILLIILILILVGALPSWATQLIGDTGHREASAYW